VSGDRRGQYAQAFYDQAWSDWQIYKHLARSEKVPRCHSLHYLQMACEKLGKAYRLRRRDADVDANVTRHVGFTKFVNEFLRSPAIMADYIGRAAQHREVCIRASAIAREIEKLAPAIDRAHSPENAEYPWEQGDWETGTGEVLVPCRYSFPSLSLLDAPGGGTFMKLMARAFMDYSAGLT
jgi:hypothetical protein